MLTSIQWSCFNSLKFRQSWYFRLIFHFFLVSYNQFQNLINNFLQFLSHPFEKKIIIQNQKSLLIIVKNAFLRLKFWTAWKESYCIIFFIVNGRKRKCRQILCLIVDCRQSFDNHWIDWAILSTVWSYFANPFLISTS